MDRRDFVGLALLAATPLGVAAPATSVLDAGVREQQARMATGALSAEALARGYLARIVSIDRAGPRLNAIIELNPDAIGMARTLDRERAAGKLRGPLHGCSVLLKDNIATGDSMRTSAGSLALAHVRATRDAGVAARLREAGAVILGKTNLSEWANMRGVRSSSGWSARGGMTRNPYALDRSCSGSSSGSAAATAAALATFAVGTETDGSIVSPASACGVVGIKPTVGLVSRAGIIPISHSQDTAGPMARSVADAALLLATLAGAAPRDASSTAAKVDDYAAALTTDGLRGRRLGVARNYFGRNPKSDALIERALVLLKTQGAELIDVQLPNTDRYNAAEYQVLLYEFKPGLASWFADYAPHAPVRDMASLIAFNLRERGRELAWFGQEHLERAQAKGALTSPEYLEALATCQRYARAEGIDQVLREYRLDALVAPTSGPVWLADLVNGDSSGGSFSGPAAVAGYPHITVPAGYVNGLPVGLSFVGTAWTEAALIGMAYSYEQASLQRQAPRFAPTAR